MWEDARGWVEALTTIGAVAVALFSLMHQRDQSKNSETRETAAVDAKTAIMLTEYAEKFSQAFEMIAREAERFRKHDLDCSAAKAQMSEQLKQTTQTLERVVRAQTALSRQMAYVARDRAEHELHERLVGKDRG